MTIVIRCRSCGARASTDAVHVPDGPEELGRVPVRPIDPHAQDCRDGGRNDYVELWVGVPALFNRPGLPAA